jgi:hypothetical protein
MLPDENSCGLQLSGFLSVEMLCVVSSKGEKERANL